MTSVAYNQGSRRLHRAYTSFIEARLMAAFIVLLLAALSRLLPHAMHGVGLNFTAVGGGLLFFGARRPRWQAVIGLAAMALTDIYLTTVAFGLHFDIVNYLPTWAWYAAVCLVGSALLRKATVLRVAGGVLASATSFFLLTNFAYWASAQSPYPRNIGGLGLCYAAGLPFYRNDLVSTVVTAGVLFGLPVLAARLVETMRSIQSRDEPVA
jgi:hypothetical protein